MWDWVHLHMPIHMSAHAHTYIHTCSYTHLHMLIHMSTHAHTCICPHMVIHMSSHAHTYIRTCSYIHLHMLIHASTYIHLHIAYIHLMPKGPWGLWGPWAEPGLRRFSMRRTVPPTLCPQTALPTGHRLRGHTPKSKNSDQSVSRIDYTHEPPWGPLGGP